KQAVEGDVHRLDLGPQTFGDGGDQVDLEAHELTGFVLELPWHVADVCSHRQLVLRGSGPCRSGQHRQGQAKASHSTFSHDTSPLSCFWFDRPNRSDQY